MFLSDCCKSESIGSIDSQDIGICSSCKEGSYFSIYCTWEQQGIDHDYWETSCNNAHSFIDGDVQENQYQYCPYCGNKIDDIPFTYEEGELV